ncbi:MerR family transcriptional regulator [Amycolatopsis sp. TRM77291]
MRSDCDPRAPKLPLAGQWHRAGKRIGQLSKRTGVSPRSLRYYEEQGLLTSSRSGAGQSHYSDAEVQRVSLIRQLFDAGLSSQVIATVLPCVDIPDDLGVAEETFTAMMRQRDRIDADIAHLIETRDALDLLIEANSRHREKLARTPQL